MTSKKELLRQIIDDLNKALIMDQINDKYIDSKAKEFGNEDSNEYQAEKSKFFNIMNNRAKQIEIALEMYKSYE